MSDPDDYTAQISKRIEDLQTDRWIKLMGLVFIGGPLLFLFNIGFAVKTHLDGSERDKLIRQGISCLLADLDDHRHTNQFAHDELAENHHFPKILQPDVIPLTPEQAQVLKRRCEVFVRRSIGEGIQTSTPVSNQKGAAHGGQRRSVPRAP